MPWLSWLSHVLERRTGWRLGAPTGSLKLQTPVDLLAVQAAASTVDRRSGAADTGGEAVASATDAVVGLRQQQYSRIGDQPSREDSENELSNLFFLEEKMCKYQANSV